MADPILNSNSTQPILNSIPNNTPVAGSMDNASNASNLPPQPLSASINPIEPPQGSDFSKFLKLAIVIMVVVIILGTIGIIFLLVKGKNIKKSSSAVENNTNQGSQAQIVVSEIRGPFLLTTYANPFDNVIQYINPFSKPTNPFDVLYLMDSKDLPHLKPSDFNPLKTNCGDLWHCRDFCKDPSNEAVCTDFGKKQSLIKDINFESKELINAMQNELDCDSQNSCQILCGNKDISVREKCSSFSKKYGLVGGLKNLSDPIITAKASEILGCSTIGACKTLCDKKENIQKCSDFVTTIGIKGGIKKVGPGECQSEESCQKFCNLTTENAKTCREFKSNVQKNASGIIL